MTITVTEFGLADDQPVREAVLRGTSGTSVHILSWGAIIRDWRLSAGGGAQQSMVLGFDDIAGYLHHSPYFGAVAGRIVNRIGQARFTLDATTYRLTRNHGDHHLHGGAVGLSKRNWALEADSGENAVRLTCHSPDGEEGYPGAVDFTVTYRLAGTRLDIAMEGRPDRPTPINMAQHSYFNLNGGGDVLDHRITIAADRYTPVDGALIPTGKILPVDGSRNDFRAPRYFGDTLGAPAAYDINLVLDDARDPMAPLAVVDNGAAGRMLRVWSNMPAVQLYNAAEREIPYPGLGGRAYGNFCGLCLETQYFPDSPNHPAFPSIIATPDRPYLQRMAIEIV